MLKHYWYCRYYWRKLRTSHPFFFLFFALKTYINLSLCKSKNVHCVLVDNFVNFIKMAYFFSDVFKNSVGLILWFNWMCMSSYQLIMILISKVNFWNCGKLVVQLSYVSHMPSLKIVMCCGMWWRRGQAMALVLHGLWYGRKLHYQCHATPLPKFQ
jgi:hypothetical protein